MTRSGCVAIMVEASLGSVEYHRGWHYSIRLSNKPGVKEVSLHPNNGSDGPWPIQLDMCPGDTMNQARALFSSINVHSLAGLENNGWSVIPNFHISFRSSNLYWCKSAISLVDYVGYWAREVAAKGLKQVARTDWPAYFAGLQAKGMITLQDAQQIDNRLSSTAMSTINICPGISFQYSWSRDDAIRLEEADTFISAFVDKVQEVLATW